MKQVRRSETLPLLLMLFSNSTGGMVLHKGQIAEMRTGEGKTLVAVLPAFLNSLTGQGVHVVTVNDYLARRDCEWVGQVHRFLGLRVGLIQRMVFTFLFCWPVSSLRKKMHCFGTLVLGFHSAAFSVLRICLSIWTLLKRYADTNMKHIQIIISAEGMTPEERRDNYGCDITYVTNSELGFDFLRDNLATVSLKFLDFATFEILSKANYTADVCITLVHIPYGFARSFRSTTAERTPLRFAA